MGSVTAIYASLLALLYAWLAVRVILYRRSNRISLGDNGDPEMRQRMRTHANCAEYAPIGVILLLLLELQGVPSWVAHASGLCLLAGRMLHAIGLQPHPMNFRQRTLGMALTLSQIIGTAIVLLLLSLF